MDVALCCFCLLDTLANSSNARTVTKQIAPQLVCRQCIRGASRVHLIFRLYPSSFPLCLLPPRPRSSLRSNNTCIPARIHDAPGDLSPSKWGSSCYRYLQSASGHASHITGGRWWYKPPFEVKCRFEALEDFHSALETYSVLQGSMFPEACAWTLSWFKRMLTVDMPSPFLWLAHLPFRIEFLHLPVHPVNPQRTPAERLSTFRFNYSPELSAKSGLNGWPSNSASIGGGLTGRNDISHALMTYINLLHVRPSNGEHSQNLFCCIQDSPGVKRQLDVLS